LRSEILKILEEDSHATPEQIATMLGISEEEVTITIKKAEADGKILKYKTLINWDKVNDEHVWALIEVTRSRRKGIPDMMPLPKKYTASRRRATST